MPDGINWDDFGTRAGAVRRPQSSTATGTGDVDWDSFGQRATAAATEAALDPATRRRADQGDQLLKDVRGVINPPLSPEAVAANEKANRDLGVMGPVVAGFNTLVDKGEQRIGAIGNVVGDVTTSLLTDLGMSEPNAREIAGMPAAFAGMPGALRTPEPIPPRPGRVQPPAVMGGPVPGGPMPGGPKTGGPGVAGGSVPPVAPAPPAAPKPPPAAPTPAPAAPTPKPAEPTPAAPPPEPVAPPPAPAAPAAPAAPTEVPVSEAQPGHTVTYFDPERGEYVRGTLKGRRSDGRLTVDRGTGPMVFISPDRVVAAHAPAEAAAPAGTPAVPPGAPAVGETVTVNGKPHKIMGYTEIAPDQWVYHAEGPKGEIVTDGLAPLMREAGNELHSAADGPWELAGKNEAGQTVYRNPQGVHAVSDDGVPHTEATKDGKPVATDETRKPTFKIVEPKPEQPLVKVDGEAGAEAEAETPESREPGNAGTAPKAPASGANVIPPVAASGEGEDKKDEKPGVTFTTAKGSTYQVHEDGTTTRNKAYRPEHGEKEQGPQPRAETTFYVTQDDARRLGEIQTQGGSGRVIARHQDGRWGVQYTEGKDAGKFESRTMVAPQSEPAVGLTPVELWDGGRRVHFGNEIVEVSRPDEKPETREPGNTNPRSIRVDEAPDGRFVIRSGETPIGTFRIGANGKPIAISPTSTNAEHRRMVDDAVAEFMKSREPGKTATPSATKNPAANLSVDGSGGEPPAEPTAAAPAAEPPQATAAAGPDDAALTDEINKIADEWEAMGNPGMAEAIRAGARMRKPTREGVQFQRDMLAKEIAKRHVNAPKPKETFDLDSFMREESRDLTRFWDHLVANASPEDKALIDAVQHAAQALTDQMNALGFTRGEAGRSFSVTPEAKRLKGRFSNLLGAFTRYVKGLVPNELGHKNANPDRPDVDRVDVLAELEKAGFPFQAAAAPEQATKPTADAKPAPKNLPEWVQALADEIEQGKTLNPIDVRDRLGLRDNWEASVAIRNAEIEAARRNGQADPIDNSSFYKEGWSARRDGRDRTGPSRFANANGEFDPDWFKGYDDAGKFEAWLTRGKAPASNPEVAKLAARYGVPTEGRTDDEILDALADKMSPEEAALVGRKLEKDREEAYQKAETAALDWILYHGTPWLFDQFDISRIGTGEGHQAFGWGLYFAEGEAIARFYRDGVRPAAFKRQREEAEAAYEAAMAAWQAKSLSMTVAEIAKNGWTAEDIQAQVAPYQKAARDAQARLNAIRSGQLYQVRVKGTPDEFLDWDKPLSEQPKAIQDKFAAMTPAALDLKPERGRFLHRNRVEYVSKTGDRVFGRADKEVKSVAELLDGESGKAIYEQFRSLHPQMSPEGASRVLRLFGIKGIRFLDAGSRAGGEGSRNVVVFDDKDIEITHRNGEKISQREKIYQQPQDRTQEDLEREQQANATPAAQQRPAGDGQPGSAREDQGAVSDGAPEGRGDAGAGGGDAAQGVKGKTSDEVAPAASAADADPRYAGRPKPPIDEGHSYAAGWYDAFEDKPRTLPSYFTKATGKNARDWFRGYDAAAGLRAASPAPSDAPPTEAEQAAAPGPSDAPAAAPRPPRTGTDRPSYWMNEHEIDEAIDRFRNHPLLGPVTRWLGAYRDAVNENSDGWPHWGGKVAQSLMGLIHQADPRHAGYWHKHGGTIEPTEEEIKSAIAPIKAFATKHGLKIPAFDAGAGKQVAPKDAAPPQDQKVVEHVTKKGKTLRGVIRTDLTKDQAHEIDPFTFRKDGGWFIRLDRLPPAEKSPVATDAQSRDTAGVSSPEPAGAAPQEGTSPAVPDDRGAASTPPDRPTYPDGRLIPQAGDRVAQILATGKPLEGEVYQGVAGPRVRITRSPMGNPAVGTTLPMGTGWTTADDPAMPAKLRRALDAQAADDAYGEQEMDKAAAETGTLDPATVNPGDMIQRFGEDVFVVTDKRRGALYVRPEDPDADEFPVTDFRGWQKIDEEPERGHRISVGDETLEKVKGGWLPVQYDERQGGEWVPAGPVRREAVGDAGPMLPGFGGSAPADDIKPVPGVRIFRSGASNPADFRAYMENGSPVGVSLAELGPNSETNRLIVDYANSGGHVFVDSGAFTAFTKGTPVDFESVLDRQMELARQVDRGRLHLVMPDVIGDQAETLRLIGQHQHKIRELIRMGHDVLIPFQKGDLPPHGVWREVHTLLGGNDFTAAIPYNKVPYTVDDLRSLWRVSGGPARIHLLGIAARQKALEAAVQAIREVAPTVEISADANRLKAGIGQGRSITRDQAENLDKYLEAIWNGSVRGLEGFDETELAGDLAMVPDFLTPQQAQSLAGTLRVPEHEWDRWVQAAKGGDLGDLLEEADPDGRMTMHWLRGQFEGAAQKAAARRARTDAVKTHDAADKAGKLQQPATLPQDERPLEAGWRNLTGSGRRDALAKTGVRLPPEVLWQHISPDNKIKLLPYIEAIPQPFEIGDRVVPKPGSGLGKWAAGIVQTVRPGGIGWQIAVGGRDFAATDFEKEPSDTRQPTNRDILKAAQDSGRLEIISVGGKPAPAAPDGVNAPTLQQPGEPATLPGQEADRGIQDAVRPGNAGTGTEDVPGAGEGGQDRGPSSGKEPGGTRDAGGTPGPRAEGQVRQSAPSDGAGGRGDRSGDPDRIPTGGGRRGSTGAAGRPDAANKGENYRIEAGALAEERGPTQKARDNLAAIELAKELDAEGRVATRAEQDILAKYVGWGGLSGAFRNPKTGQFGQGFETIGSRLKEILTPEEYDGAENSTQYAHYTAEHVIRSMWDAVKQLGFKGGNVFEPGMGIGHFLGLMPGDLGDHSQYRGIEKDPITARIARHLYPQSGVQQADFKRLPLPEGAYDLVIGNPPFSDTRVTEDPKYAPRRFMLHDYFFAKSLDAVRPGGLLAFITSAGTMNKLETKAREYLAERAEFLGGIRLPSTAFKQNAGTEVTTDILFFKRRPEGKVRFAPAEVPDWTQTVVRDLPDRYGGTTPGAVNRWFSEHPEAVLGVEGFWDQLVAGLRYGVRERANADLPADLRNALQTVLPRDVMDEPESPADRAEMDFESGQKKDGSYYISKDGRLMQYEGGVGRPVQMRGAKGGGTTKDEAEKIKALIPIRDALRDVFAADLKRDEAAGQKARAALNQHYDAFVKKYGPINKAERTYHRPNAIQEENARLKAREDARSAGDYWNDGDFDPSALLAAGKGVKEISKARQFARDKAREMGVPFNEGSFDPDDLPDVVREKLPNIDPFMADPESYRLRSIERYDDATGAGSKKDIFFRNILTFDEEPEVHSAADGVLWSYNKLGRFDLDAIAEKLGQPREAVIVELGDQAFRVPNAGDTWQSADEYLSGDVVSKLAEAQVAAKADPTLERNVKALEAALPPPYAPSQILIRLGMPWIPERIVQDFVEDHLDLGPTYIKYSPAVGTWTVTKQETNNPYARRRKRLWQNDAAATAGQAKWGTEKRTAHELLADALNRTPPKIYTYDSNLRKDVFDREATQVAQDKVEQMMQAFNDWIEADTALGDRLADIFNTDLNRNVLRKYDGSWLKTPGISAAWKWRPHQTSVVSRIILSGNTYMAHAVGAGKAQPLDAKILTPQGWRLMGELRVGDEVIAADGTAAPVIGVFPQGNKEIFRVRFSDGASTECCDEHLWVTWDYKARNYASAGRRKGRDWACAEPQVRPLYEIRKTLIAPRLGAKNHSIPIVKPVVFPARDVSVDPYLIGVLLGDGGLTSASVSIHTADDEIIREVRKALPADLALSRIANGDGCPMWNIVRTKQVGFGADRQPNPLREALKVLGMVGVRAEDKSVPEIYKLNDVSVRLAVLQGLLDTDGSVSRRGHSTYFYSTSVRLADDVEFLARSLGGVVTRRIKTPHYTHNGERRAGLPCHVLCLSLPPEVMPFRLTRKATLVKAKTKYPPRRYIVAVDRVGTKEAQCIAIDHPSRLYVTDDFIVTHNTSAMIGAGMEMRRLGLVRKPMYVVPNHMLGQFTKEFYEQYPTARIAVADERNFITDRRKQFMANVAAEDLDAVIITHSSFGKIPVSAGFSDDLVRQEIEILEEAIEDLDKGKDRLTVKRLRNRKEKLEQKLRKSEGGRKDQTITFEEMGVDFLFVDEAHLFRKLPFSTKIGDLKGVDPDGSDMAWDLYTKIRYLDQERPGRSVVLASGTPVTNTMGELFSISRYIQPQALAKAKVTHFDSWVQNFATTKTALEQSPSGGYITQTRLAKFQNMPVLYKMVGEVMDIVTSAELEKYVTRPKLQDGERKRHMAPITPHLEEFQQKLKVREAAIRARKGPPGKGDDILLSLINDGRHAAIDMRMVEPAQNDPRSKLNMMIDNVARIWRETADHQFYDPASGYKEKSFRGPATQMIFSNMGVNPRGPLSFGGYAWIKAALTRAGVPANEIAFIGDYKTHIQRQSLFNDLNEGRVRILVGSVQKMGTGVNAQRRLVALHNLDPLWYPADDEQRLGRILRQGNHNHEVQVHDYSTKGTYDAVMWDMMARKARFIEQFFRGDPNLMEMEDLGEATLYEQAAAMTTTDPRIMQLTEWKQELDKHQARARGFDREQYNIRTQIRQAAADAANARETAAKIDADIAVRQDTRGKAFRMTVGGETYDDRAEAAKALGERRKNVEEHIAQGATTRMGGIGGLSLMIQRDHNNNINTYFYLKGAREYGLGGDSVEGVIASAEHVLRNLEAERDRYLAEAAESDKTAAAYRPQLDRKFEHGERMKELKELIRKLEDELRAEEKGQAAGGTGQAADDPDDADAAD